MLAEIFDLWTIGHIFLGLAFVPFATRIHWPLWFLTLWEVFECWMHPLGMGDASLIGAGADIAVGVIAWALGDRFIPRRWWRSLHD